MDQDLSLYLQRAYWQCCLFCDLSSCTLFYSLMTTLYNVLLFKGYFLVILNSWTSVIRSPLAKTTVFRRKGARTI